ncbi:protein FAR1-RELATED SEQUENCE 5-like [Chenopodium quinoa]|uniref:protein FAR1-RELATED SEQUENCE 5-like n=1 Tax=Chenopodium quinoa TaxID=63459 RepID=UPI000B77E49B|nr:protein FAR1-RELATED SEQUENCE 5-like [Chenopodium quinoa]
MELVVVLNEIINAESINAVVFKEVEVSGLMMRKEVRSEQKAFDLYNDYAFKIGFSIRRSNVRIAYKTNIWRSRKYVCSNAGLKDDSKKDVRRFEKLDFRTNCGALVEFIIDKHGVWTAVQHLMEHNHPIIPIDMIHLLRSQRKVNKEQLKVINVMKASGVRVTDSIRLLSKEVGGSLNLGCTRKDIYNALDVEKSNRLDDSDCNQSIKYFAQRQAKESDFYYEFEVDETNSLTCTFWRDGRMKRDYKFFGDMMVFDTTYRTNKYDMICALFVGMNYHCNNVMFGMGFVLDEKTASFIWLFESFMRLMGGGRHPTTIMTNQTPSIAAGIQNSNIIGQDYVKSRAEIEFTFNMLREKVERVRGPINFDGGEEVEEVPKEGQPIQNRKTNRKKKGKRNDKRKSTVEKACNKSKGWKKKVDKYKDEMKATAKIFFQYFDARCNARNEESSNASGSSKVSHYDEILSIFDKTSNT